MPYDDDSAEAKLGAEAEVRFRQYLTRRGYLVVPTHSFIGNSRFTDAPMIEGPGDTALICPDLLAFPPSGPPVWYEVKAKRMPGWRLTRKRWEHGIDHTKALQYAAVKEKTGIDVRLICFEQHSPTREPSPGEDYQACLSDDVAWLEIAISEALAVGITEENWPVPGDKGVLWAREQMQLLQQEAPPSSWPAQADVPGSSQPDDGGDGCSVETADASSLQVADSAASPAAWPEMQEQSADTVAQYSELFVRTAPAPAAVLSRLRAGIRVFVFDDDVTRFDIPELAPFKAASLLSVESIPAGIEGTATVCDGRLTDAGRPILEAIDALESSQFNLAQYLVTHASADSDLQVRAGAGTGKTTVMVERVIFLLSTASPTLKLSEIALITFTRAATRIMRDRLRNALLTRFRLTGKRTVLAWLSELPQMQISTIPAFSRQMLMDLGPRFGLGRSFAIRSFTIEKRRILEERINDMIQTGRIGLRSPADLPMQLHVLEATLERFWGRLENRGLVGSELGHIDWGTARRAPAIAELLRNVFVEAEEALTQVKDREHARTISDLTRLLRGVSGAKDAPSVAKLRYLFVDEFQDTDDAQIALVAQLRTELPQLRLFVVGDVKQSIYRFRGATHIAFEELSCALQNSGISFMRFPLSKNFRTERSILERLHQLFSVWGQNSWLTYEGQHDRLRATLPASAEEGAFRVRQVRRQQALQEMASLIRNDRQQNSSPRTTAVIVRTNRDARQVRDALGNAGVTCRLDRGGEFFCSEPVRDVHLLVRALLRPDDPEALGALAAFGLAERAAPWRALAMRNGTKSALREDLGAPYSKWSDLLRAARLEPAPAVLVRAVEIARLEARFAQRRRQQARRSDDDERQAELDCLRYGRNLDHLLTLIHETFGSSPASLFTLEKWLAINKATNREEDEPPLSSEEKAGQVIAVTVHRAKGEEYDTVVVPLTDRPFSTRGDALIVEEGPSGWRAGWKLIVRGGDPPIENNFWAAMMQDEASEAEREEARLLYVALTRVKSRLWIIREPAPRAQTWSNFLAAV